MKAVERHDTPSLWINPENFWIIAMLRHGKYARGITLHQQIRGERHCSVVSIVAEIGIQPLFEPVNIVVTRQNGLFFQQGMKQRDGCVDAVHDQFSQSPM